MIWNFDTIIFPALQMIDVFRSFNEQLAISDLILSLHKILFATEKKRTDQIARIMIHLGRWIGRADQRVVFRLQHMKNKDLILGP